MKHVYFLVGVLTASLLVAQDDITPNWYVGFKAGISDYGDAIDCSDCNGLASIFNDISEHGVSTGLFAGYQFHKYFAVEAAFQDFGIGEFGISGSGPIFDEIEEARIDLNSRGIDLGFKGILPVSKRIRLFAKLGWQFYRLEAESKEFRNDVLTEEDREHYSDSGISYAAGLDIKLSQAWKLHLNLERYRLEPISDFSFNVPNYSVGISYHF